MLNVHFALQCQKRLLPFPRQQLHHNSAHMSSHCETALCVKALQKTTIMTPKPLWGSEWEQDKNEKKKKKKGASLTTTPKEAELQNGQTPSHTHSKMPLIAWEGRLFLHRVSKCESLPETACCKDKRLQRWKCQSIRWLNNSHPSQSEISACQKCGFLSKTQSMWQVGICFFSLVLSPAFSFTSFYPPPPSLLSLKKCNSI